MNYVHAFSGFSADDLKAEAAFYKDKLGVAARETPQGLELQLPDGMQVFIYEKPNHQPATFTVLNLVVENIDEAVDALVQNGVKFEIYTDMPFTQDEKGIARGLAANMGPDIAWLKDPAGNILAVLQVK